MTVTNMRLNLLAAVEEICEESGSGYASPADVQHKLKRNARAIRKMMLKLRGIGWLENPYRGCYRLTEEGRKVLGGARRE